MSALSTPYTCCNLQLHLSRRCRKMLRAAEPSKQARHFSGGPDSAGSVCASGDDHQPTRPRGQLNCGEGLHYRSSGAARCPIICALKGWVISGAFERALLPPCQCALQAAETRRWHVQACRVKFPPLSLHELANTAPVGGIPRTRPS